MTLGHKWKLTLGRELWPLNGKEMTLGHKWKSTVSREHCDQNGKEMTLGHKLKSTLGDYYRKVLFCRPNYKGFKHLWVVIIFI